MLEDAERASSLKVYEEVLSDLQKLVTTYLGDSFSQQAAVHHQHQPKHNSAPPSTKVKSGHKQHQNRSVANESVRDLSNHIITTA